MYFFYNTCDMKQYEIGLQTWLLWPLLRPFRKDKMSWEELGKPEELQAGPFFRWRYLEIGWAFSFSDRII